MKILDIYYLSILLGVSSKVWCDIIKMASVKLLNSSLTLICLVGLGLSIYSYVIEQATENDKNYKAMCDISENVSCTKAFKSK